MLNMVKRFFSKVKEGDLDAAGQETGHDIHVATCALLVEIARIDGTFTNEEMETVLTLLGIPSHIPDSTKIYDLEEIDESITMHTVKMELSKYLDKG